MKEQTTIDAAEVARFSRLSHQWWDTRGPFAPLHRINALRVEWIVGRIKRHWGLGIGDWGKQSSSLMPNAQPLIPLTLLDIGCGGGLACEPFARLGARVTGIDASAENIEIAKAHASQSGLDIDYRNTTAEELLSSLVTSHQPLASLFDIVLALEIVEHVADVPFFIESVCKLVKPGGLVIMSTLNRTAKSFALGIVGAEYVLRWVPRGTHQWEKFIKPSELAAHLRANGIEITEMTGMVFDPLAWKWKLDAEDVSVNYLVAGTAPHKPA